MPCGQWEERNGGTKADITCTTSAGGEREMLPFLKRPHPNLFTSVGGTFHLWTLPRHRDPNRDACREGREIRRLAVVDALRVASCFGPPSLEQKSSLYLVLYQSCSLTDRASGPCALEEPPPTSKSPGRTAQGDSMHSSTVNLRNSPWT